MQGVAALRTRGLLEVVKALGFAKGLIAKGLRAERVS